MTLWLRTILPRLLQIIVHELIHCILSLLAYQHMRRFEVLLLMLLLLMCFAPRVDGWVRLLLMVLVDEDTVELAFEHLLLLAPPVEHELAGEAFSAQLLEWWMLLRVVLVLWLMLVRRAYRYITPMFLPRHLISRLLFNLGLSITITILLQGMLCRHKQQLIVAFRPKIIIPSHARQPTRLSIRAYYGKLLLLRKIWIVPFWLICLFRSSGWLWAHKHEITVGGRFIRCLMVQMG